MKQIILLITRFLILMVLLISCKKDDTIYDNSKNKDYTKLNTSEGEILLGKQLEDPYALKNMKMAYSNLKSYNSEIPDIELMPTHSYYRFLPKDQNELDLLKSDSTLILNDFPFDFELVNPGTYYHDPTLPASSITWQYCVIPIGQAIPNIHKELLYEVYIPFSEDSISLKSTSAISQFLYDLEEESFRLTGNLQENYNLNTKGLLPSQYTPKGTITVWDDLLGRYIPLNQATVRAWTYTKVDSKLTNSNGYFELDKFRYEVNYSIKWERLDFEIRNGMVAQAYFNGPKKRGDWNLDIRYGESVMYASIHRAAFKHFYGDNLGIYRPYKKDRDRTKLCYMDGIGTGMFWGDIPGSDIQIWGKNDAANYKPTNQVFSTTTHELGHQSHYEFIKNVQYWQVSKFVYESWAEAVEWALTNDEYNKLGLKYSYIYAVRFNHQDGIQDWVKSQTDWEYSPIFIDLMDNFNQRYSGSTGNFWHTGNVIYPDDRVSGYTLSYLNSFILRDSYGYTSLRDAVKNHKLTGITDKDIDDLFLLY